MQITWFGHSAFRVELPGAALLIDPFFNGNPSFTGDVAQASAGVTHIVLTHGHGDHLGDTLTLAETTGAKVVANFDLCMWLAHRGLKSFEPMGTGGTVDLGPFAVTLVNAVHASAYLDENGVSHVLGNPNGVIIRAPGEKVLYHMGDTDIFGDMALISELYAPDIGLVPIGDRFTMGARTAALAVKRFFDFETVIPCHYGSFPIVDQTADKFLAEMGDQAGKVRVPAIGETLTL